MLVSLVAVTICILAVLVSLFIYKSVSEILRPVYTMIDVSNQLTAGHFDIPDIDYPLSNEMGRLVESFNQMKNATGRLMTAMEEKRHALDISLERVADIIGASPGYFSKLFKQHFGQTFLERLTQIRIQQAKKLLRTTDKSTREIGEAVGYPSITYFNAKFKKETGLPPAEYRRNPPEE